MKNVLLMFIALTCLLAMNACNDSVSADDSVDVRNEYYESGELKSETPYIDGKIHGIEKWYYESGELLFEIPFVNGKIHGIWKTYYKSGQLMRESPFTNGKIHGIVIDYYENGQIKEETLYVDGELIDTINYDDKNVKIS
jgi:antitoxin component YwqK of YwqJK toxin-antitoxin module